MSGSLAVAPGRAGAAGPSVGAALLHLGGGGAVLVASLAMAATGGLVGVILMARGQRALA